MLPELEPELPLLATIATVSDGFEAWKGRLPGGLLGLRYTPGDPYEEYGITLPGG